MKQISFTEFCDTCNEFRVEHTTSRLRVDFDKKLETLLGKYTTNQAYVGGDNDKEGFVIGKDTFVSIVKNTTNMIGTRLDGTEEVFTYRKW